MKKRLLSALLTFCMVLTLLPVSALAVDSPADSSVSTSKDGITINKTVSGDKDNGYELTLEAYANNTVTATTVFTPLDIVLVLDQSGSMTDEFEGSSNRQAAMKSAVISFIDSVIAASEIIVGKRANAIALSHSNGVFIISSFVKKSRLYMYIKLPNNIT